MEAKAGREAAYDIDERIACWRQGDLALGERWFVHVGLEAESSAPVVLTTEVVGLMVVTQTCDLVRRHALRPFVEFAPLIALDPEIWESVWRGERPSMATLSCLRAVGLAADLDRAMTVEKRIVAEWVRTEGCMNETEVRLLADALARHLSHCGYGSSSKVLRRTSNGAAFISRRNGFWESLMFKAECSVPWSRLNSYS